MTGHPVVHFEIGCHDGPATRTSLQQLLGWDISSPGTGMTIAGGGPRRISGHIVELAAERGPSVTVDVEVANLEHHLERVAELGGQTLVPPVTLPGEEPFAWFAAPEGTIIGLWPPH